MELGAKDPQTVTPTGKRTENLIEGVILRSAVTQSDERGELCEIYDPAWFPDLSRLVYVYATIVKPGRVKGWVYHKKQADRLFVLSGFLKIVLYDPRETSTTRGMVNEIHLSERSRGLVTIPPLVVHAVQNIGTVEGSFVNMPSEPYRHSDPDKYRVDRADVPYVFDKGSGW